MVRLLKTALVLLLLGGAVYLGHGYLLTKAGEYLVQNDEMKPADVIVVLAGEETERVEHGVRLFREEWSKKDRIVMAGGPVVWKYSWASLMREHAVALGVPAGRIVLEDRSRSTEEDALFTRDILRQSGYRSIILVTSPYHSKRAAIIFRKVFGKDIRVISAPVADSWFSPQDWWKRRRDRATVLNEYSKFLWLLLFGLQETPPS